MRKSFGNGWCASSTPYFLSFNFFGYQGTLVDEKETDEVLYRDMDNPSKKGSKTKPVNVYVV